MYFVNGMGYGILAENSVEIKLGMSPANLPFREWHKSKDFENFMTVLKEKVGL